VKEELAVLAESLEGVEPGQLFGKPSLKVGKSHFVCGFQQCLVVKVGKEAIEEMLPKFEGSVLFDPSGKGRPMKDWLQIPEDYKDQWPSLALQALDFVK
jgi:hypothetical protein